MQRSNIFRNVLLIGFLAFLLSIQQPLIASAGINVWTSNGPEGGSIYALAIDPQNPTTMYAGTGSGGVYKSTDGGGSWSLADTGLTNKFIQVLVIDPKQSTTIYAGTMNTPVFKVPTGGVFKSTNAGGSWSLVSTELTNTDVRALVIDPQTSDTLYAGTGWGGVFKTINGGQSWITVNTGLTNISVQALTIDPKNPTTLYAGTWGGVFKSINGGETWSAVNTGLTNNHVQALAIDPQSPNTLYAGTDYGGGVVFKSTDGGGLWSPANTGLPDTHVYAIAINPLNPTILYAGTQDGGGMFKSTNGGVSWSPVNNGLVSNNVVHAIAINSQTPITLYAGTYGGIFKSINGGGSWSETNTGLAAAEIMALAIDPSTPTTLYAGMDGGVFKSLNAGGSWRAANIGLTFTDIQVLAINPQTPNILYAGSWYGGVFKSINGGGSWSAINNGLTSLSVGALTIDPQLPTTLYAGTWYSGGVFKSTNAGGSWNAINNGLTQMDVGTLAVDPISPSTIYAGTRDGVFKSINGGANWFAANTGLDGDQVDSLVIDSQTPATLYAGTYRYGLFKSTNGGESWSAVNSGFPPNIFVVHPLIDPQSPNILYAGTYDGGVFKSTDGGGSWNPLNDGLTNTWVLALAIDPQNPSNVYAGTGGGGVFSYTGPILSISHIEITQGIQNPTNSVPLIIGKPSIVRVYADCGPGCTSTSGIIGKLQVSSPAGTINLTSSPKTVYHPTSWSDQQSDYNRTFNFIVPTNLGTGNVTFKATVGSVSISETVTFQPARTPRIAYIPIHYAPDISFCLWTGSKDPDSARIASAQSWALKVYPTNQIDYIPWPTMDWILPLRQGLLCEGGWNDANIRQLKFALSLRMALDQSVNRPDYVFGWVPDAAIPGGESDPTWAQGIGVAALGDDEHEGPRIFAHEIGHLMGARHTNSVSCYPEKIDSLSQWPFKETDSLIHDWGLDLLPKDPTTTYDYMSYCGRLSSGDVWTSAWTYNQIYTRTLEVQTTIPVISTQPTLQPYFITSGLVYTNGTATLNPIWVIPTAVPSQNPLIGTQYCLEAQDISGIALISHCFDLSFKSYETGTMTDVDGFTIMLPYPSGTARIVLKKAQQELALRYVSSNAPIVTVLSPITGDFWADAGDYTVKWIASDVDNDPLTYSILYSPEGSNWTPIAVGITQTQLIINAADLAGGAGAKIRVLVTDGVNTSAGESALFSVGSKAPEAYILSPVEGGVIPVGLPLLLQAYAYDMEDGLLADIALQWNSDRDGDLGTGRQVLVNLSYGQHVITLTASDSNGNFDIETVNVFVGSKFYLPIISR